MAGIDFMALANGMMLGDKLNKEDDTYWRKQQQEDITAQNNERNQAYKEKAQGYILDDSERRAQDIDASRLVSQAYDTYANAAKAQGIPVHQLLLNSPEFNLPNATPEMQSAFNGKMRAGPIAEVVRGLRAAGKFDDAAAVETKFGIATSAKENPLSFMGDPAKVDAHISKTLGASKNEDGTYTFAGVTVSPSQAFAFTNMRPADVLASVANLKAQQDVNAKNATAQSSLEKSNANTADQEARRIIYKFQSEGANKSIVNPTLHGLWDEMAAARAQAGGAAGAGAKAVDPLTAMTTQPTGPVTPGVSPTGGYPVTSAPALPSPAVPPSAPAMQPVEAQWREALAKTQTLDAEIAAIEGQKKKVQHDVQTMTSLSGRSHFDPAVIENARAKLAELSAASKAKTEELNRVHSAVRAAPIKRPAYVDQLNSTYR
jgi:hypothetical protein